MKYAAVFLVMLGLVGRMDYDDQRAEEAAYCDMVKEGYWPDYREQCSPPNASPR